jgi:hypothetical protein
VITPAGGASKVAYIGTILQGQKLHVAVLLDSDPAGQQAFEQLVHQWILKEKLVVMLGDVVGTRPCALEDLFGETFYLNKVNETFVKELSGKTLSLDPKTAGKKTIVDRVQDAFTALNFGDFNKGRVSKRITLELAKKDLRTLDTDTAAKFRKVIDGINSLVTNWKK